MLIFVLGATNRPQELDEAARRRLAKRLYIPLPDQDAREQLIRNVLNKNNNSTAKQVDISDEEYTKIAEQTDGYSGADLENVVNEAAMYPLREIGTRLKDVAADEIRPIM